MPLWLIRHSRFCLGFVEQIYFVNLIDRMCSSYLYVLGIFRHRDLFCKRPFITSKIFSIAIQFVAPITQSSPFLVRLFACIKVDDYQNYGHIEKLYEDGCTMFSFFIVKACVNSVEWFCRSSVLQNHVSMLCIIMMISITSSS